LPLIVSPSSLPLYFVVRFCPFRSRVTEKVTVPSLKEASSMAVSVLFRPLIVPLSLSPSSLSLSVTYWPDHARKTRPSRRCPCDQTERACRKTWCCTLPATSAERKSAGIEYARRLLGHANISTTQRYVHLDDRELADAQDLVE
jgi:hypothetical protein